MTSMHPLTLTNDSEVATCYHSFFTMLLKTRNNIDDIEQGIKIFILSAISKLELGGSFVITLSDSNKFYSFWIYFQSSMKIFVSISKFLHYSNLRQLIYLLRRETEQGYIQAQLLTLCEIPIISAQNTTYLLQLRYGCLKVLFNLSEQIIDTDIDFISLSLLSPLMILKVWESIILERKVLVIFENISIISSCCD